MIATQMHLPGLRPGRYLTLEEQYQEWRATPQAEYVVGLVRDRALSLRRRGVRHYGLRAIWEAVRYEVALAYPKGGPKMNDHWPPFVARELMDAVPDLAEMFELRERRSR